MPKFRVKEKTFINNVIYDEGTVVEYDPGVDKEGKPIEPGAHLVLVKEGRKADPAVDAAS